MRKTRFAALGLFALLLGATAPMSGQVVLTVKGQASKILDPTPSEGPGQAQSHFGGSEATQGVTFSIQELMPRYRVDMTAFSDTTLWSANNFGGFPVPLRVTYLNTDGAPVKTVDYTVDPAEVVSVNIRDVDGLPTTPSGIALGMVSFAYNNAFSFDAFQIDVSKDFASTVPIIGVDELCTNFITRFITFLPGETSVLTIYANGPLGVGAADPPTLLGAIFDESGVLVTTFTLKSSKASFVVDIADIVPSTLAAGTLQLSLDTLFNPGGYIWVEHRADGRFSTRVPAHCADGLA